MMENNIITLIGFALIGAGGAIVFVMLWAWLTIRRFNNEVRGAVKEAIKDLEKNMMGVAVEEDGGQLYFYRQEDRQFICQGTTMAEARKKINDAYPEKITYLAEGDPELLQRLRDELEIIKKQEEKPTTI